MIAYSKASLERLRINNTIEIWKKKDLISKESLEKIKEKYKQDLYTPNLFIRIALFFFTIILASTAFSFITLITAAGSDESAFGIRSIIYGAIALTALEIIIHNKKMYRAGIDDALLYIALSFLITGICIIIFNITSSYERISSEKNYILICLLLSFPLLSAAAIRYSDMLIAILTYCCLFAIMFFTLNQAGQIAQALIPFAGIFLSGLVYFFTKKCKAIESLIVWKDVMTTIEILSLFTFYLSGNYFVVRELSEILFPNKLPMGEDIPFAIIFYLFTSLIPLSYLYRSIQSKDRILLRTGLIILAMAVLTFKYYYSLGHHEISLTLAGILLISIAWIVIRYLRTSRHGFTIKEDTHGNTLLNTDIETIIIAESFKVPNQNKGFDFGGGKFGGGGAGSNY